MSEPLLTDPCGAARLLNVSRRQLDRWARSGVLGPRPLRIGEGKRLFYRVDELKTWVAAGCPSRVRWAGGEALRLAGNG